MKEVIDILRQQASVYRKVAEELESVANRLQNDQKREVIVSVSSKIKKEDLKIPDFHELERLDKSFKKQKDKRGYHLTTKEKKCPVCGKTFQPTGNCQKYCSKECSNIGRQIAEYELGRRKSKPDKPKKNNFNMEDSEKIKEKIENGEKTTNGKLENKVQEPYELHY